MLALWTLEHEISGLNLAGGGIRFKTVWCFIAQSLLLYITLPLSRYDLINVERDIKHEIIFIILMHSESLNHHSLTKSYQELGFSYTLKPLYNTVGYNMVLDITRFKDGSQKCIAYIEK